MNVLADPEIVYSGENSIGGTSRVGNVQSHPADTTVIFGTSMTQRLISSKLSKGTHKKCINISNSGDTILKISQRIEQFYHAPKHKSRFY